MKRARNWQELRREVSSYDNHAENLLPAHWVFGIEAFVDAVRLHSEAVECELAGIDSTIESLVEKMDRVCTSMENLSADIVSSIDKLTESI